MIIQCLVLGLDNGDWQMASEHGGGADQTGQGF